MHNLMLRLICVVGFCVMGCSSGSGATSPDMGGGTCKASSCNGTCCNNKCIDTNIDINNCGACDNSCGGSGATCANGQCQCGTSFCTAEQTCCSSTCQNLKTDALNCGMCGKTCTGGQVCVNGSCSAPSCTPACSGATPNCCSNGCTDIATDVNNCGACGSICPNGQTCTNSACGTGGTTGGLCCDINASTWPQCGDLDPSMAAMLAMAGVTVSKCMDVSIILDALALGVTLPPGTVGVCTANLITALTAMDFGSFSSCLTPDVIAAIMAALGGGF